MQEKGEKSETHKKKRKKTSSEKKE